MNKNTKKKFKFPWKLLFNTTIVILTIIMVAWFTFSEDGLIDLIKKIQIGTIQINNLWIVMAVAVHLLNIAIDATLIYLLLKKTVPTLKPKTALTTSMIGQFFCAVTPSATGGQPMQILSMSREGIKPSYGTSALVQKFLVWQFTLTAYCLISISFGFPFLIEKINNPTMWTLTIIGFLAQVGMIVVLLLASFCKGITTRIVSGLFHFLGKIHLMKDVETKIEKTAESLESFHSNNKALTKDKKFLIKIYALTFIQMTSLFLVPYCIAKAFNVDCDIFQMVFAQSYVSMVSSLMPLPGGSGAAEYSFFVFFGAYFSELTLKSALLIWRTITYYGTIILSMPFSQMHNKKSPETLVETQKE